MKGTTKTGYPSIAKDDWLQGLYQSTRFNTPLHLVLANSGDLDTVKLLLQNSKDVKNLVSATNENQQTPFQLGTKSSIKLLLEFISNQRASDKDQNTPLHLEVIQSGNSLQYKIYRIATTILMYEATKSSTIALK